MAGESVLMVGPPTDAHGGIVAYVEGLVASLVDSSARMERAVFPTRSWREGLWETRGGGDEGGAVAEPKDVEGRWFSRGLGAAVRIVEGIVAIAKIGTRAITGDYDIIHVHTSSYIGFYEKLLLSVLVTKGGGKSILHIHGSQFPEWFNESPAQGLAELLMQQLDVIICVSGEAHSVIRTNNTVVVPNGVNVPESPRLAVERNGNIGVLSLSVLVERKRIDSIIRGFAELLTENDSGANKIELIVAGSGPLKPDLKKLSQSLGVDACVKFPGWVTGDGLEEIWRKSQIFVSASRKESFGLSQAEALGRGKIVVATNTGMANKVIESGRNGYLMSEATPEEVAEGLTWAVNRIGEFEKMSMENWRTVKEKYGWESVGRRVLSIYNEIS